MQLINGWWTYYCIYVIHTRSPFCIVIVKYAEVSPTHKDEGRGSLLFRLINMREPVIMGFLTGGEFSTKNLLPYCMAENLRE